MPVSSDSQLPTPAQGGAQTQPPTPLAALQAFRDIQRKRAEYWQEYAGAIADRIRWVVAVREARERERQHVPHAQPPDGPDSTAQGVHAPGSKHEDNPATGDSPHGQPRQSCAQAAGVDVPSIIAHQQTSSTADELTDTHDHSHGHLTAAATGSNGLPPEVTMPLLQQIINLVTQGLLDCSHQTRQIEAYLRDPTTQRSQASSAGQRAQPVELARLLGSIQDLENKLLRVTVERDQLRTSVLHGADIPPARTDEDEDVDARVGKREQSRKEIREEINDLMSEVQAEIAQWQAEEDE